jgi:hypothetical protein
MIPKSIKEAFEKVNKTLKDNDLSHLIKYLNNKDRMLVGLGAHFKMLESKRRQIPVDLDWIYAQYNTVSLIAGLDGQCKVCTSPINVVEMKGAETKNMPKKGDYVVCVCCGTIGQFDNDLNLDPCDEKGLDNIMEKDAEMYTQMNAASYYIVEQTKIKEGKNSMKKVFIDIHKAIHNPNQKQLKVNGTSTEIQTTAEGLRFVKFTDTDKKDWEIVQQNPNTSSTYAKRAKEGEKISWVIPMYFNLRKQDGWKVVTDNTPVTKDEDDKIN